MEPLLFDPAIADGKPHSVNQDPCPFCDRRQWSHILKEEGDMVWLENKFPVMPQTNPTVLIETAVCEADITTYTPAQWERILRFGISNWREMMAQEQFESVIFYRNYGPLSGGSIRHPHSQIIGMYIHNYLEQIRPAHLTGEVIWEEGNVRCTWSNIPVGSIREMNVTCYDDASFDIFARRIQDLVCWTCDPNGAGFDSYNLFFYDAEGTTCKIVPRAVSNPFFHGYRLAQSFIPPVRAHIAEQIGAYIQARIRGIE